MLRHNLYMKVMPKVMWTLLNIEVTLLPLFSFGPEFKKVNSSFWSCNIEKMEIWQASTGYQ